jgi:hypothetical protein
VPGTFVKVLMGPVSGKSACAKFLYKHQHMLSLKNCRIFAFSNCSFYHFKAAIYRLSSALHKDLTRLTIEIRLEHAPFVVLVYFFLI